VSDPTVPVVAEAELSAAPPGYTARLILDLGHADAAAAAVTHAPARGVLTQIQALLADPSPAGLAHLRGALAAPAQALTEWTTEQTIEEATVTALDTPLMRGWQAHPAGRKRR
jgi:hypothetical protein